MHPFWSVRRLMASALWRENGDNMKKGRMQQAFNCGLETLVVNMSTNGTLETNGMWDLHNVYIPMITNTQSIICGEELLLHIPESSPADDKSSEPASKRQKCNASAPADDGNVGVEEQSHVGKSEEPS